MFSDQYKKMCERAAKLQEAWKPAEKDYYLEKGTTYPQMILSDSEKEEISRMKDNYIWLPSGNMLYRPELQRAGMILSDKLLEKAISSFWEEAKEGKIKIIKGDAHIQNLQAAMNILFFQEWDAERDVWIER